MSIEGIKEQQQQPPQSPSSSASSVKRQLPELGSGVAEDQSKRAKTGSATSITAPSITIQQKGIAAIKQQYIVTEPDHSVKLLDQIDDDANEQADADDKIDSMSGDTNNNNKKGKKNNKKNKKQRGQNKKRELVQPKEKVQLCTELIDPDDESRRCTYGIEKCRRCHDINVYLASKPPDVGSTDGATSGSSKDAAMCPNYAVYGKCLAGMKCRWLSSHYDTEAKKLIKDEAKYNKVVVEGVDGDASKRDLEVNKIDSEIKTQLQKKKYDFSKSEAVIQYLDKIVLFNSRFNNVSAEERERQDGLANKEVANENQEQSEHAKALEKAAHPVPTKEAIFDIPGDKEPAYEEPASSEPASNEPHNIDVPDTNEQEKQKEIEHAKALEKAAHPVPTKEAIFDIPGDKEPAYEQPVSNEPHNIDVPDRETTTNDDPVVVLASSNKQTATQFDYGTTTRKDNQFDYVESPFKPWEKKRLYYNAAKVVSPLTTVGNLPYRRLMKSLYNVDVTFSEMALGLPLISGHNAEWALMKAHSSEYPGFGAQIATSKHWQAVKAAELIAKYAPQTSEINLNCGCPIDLLYKQGAGSGLLDQPAKTLRMLKGMSLVSDDVPVTVKIRMGTRDNHPNADMLVKKVLSEAGGEVGAITLHGRSRQQRYTKTADWDYISQIGKIVQDYNQQQQEDKEARDLPNKKVWFIGNGDCYNFGDWHKAVSDPNIDSVMVARGALIKPWLFEEIDAKQYLDKSATERLAIIEQYARYAINHWGADDYGVNLSRRFLCEWLSFTYRYIPVGILEKLPNQLNERPPKWKGRNELETLLGSGDYKDWIKITEMFLGPAHPDFNFIPKHKSNAY